MENYARYTTRNILCFLVIDLLVVLADILLQLYCRSIVPGSRPVESASDKNKDNPIFIDLWKRHFSQALRITGDYSDRNPR